LYIFIVWLTMNSNTALLTVGIAAALALVVAPSLSSSAFAVKTVTPEECTGDPQARAECPGESGGTNPNRAQEECTVTGGGDQIVQGQQKKVCD
jgi:hypothetical protein